MSESALHNERELLHRISEGDEQAFAEFYHGYYKLLRPFIWKHLPTSEDAEEVIQQVFLRAWLHRDKLIEIENVKAWLFKVASREYLTHIRNRIERRIKTSPLENTVEAKTEFTEPFPLKELNELIGKAIETLSPQRKLIFELSRREQLSIAEIAERSGLSPKTVKNTLTAALAHVRAYLLRSGYAISIITLLLWRPFL